MRAGTSLGSADGFHQDPAGSDGWRLPAVCLLCGVMRQGGAPLAMPAEAGAAALKTLAPQGCRSRSSPTRAARLRKVPTMRELGQDLVSTIRSDLYLPAATPTELLDRTEAARLRMMATAAVVDGLKGRGMPIEARRRASLDRALVHPAAERK